MMSLFTSLSTVPALTLTDGDGRSGPPQNDVTAAHLVADRDGGCAPRRSCAGCECERAQYRERERCG